MAKLNYIAVAVFLFGCLAFGLSQFDPAEDQPIRVSIMEDARERELRFKHERDVELLGERNAAIADSLRRILYARNDSLKNQR